MSRSLVHLLLSLFLRGSQQQSLGPGYTHWAERGDGAAAQAMQGINGGNKPAKPGLHDLCGQCAASAQIAFALPAAVRQFVPAELAYAAPAVPETPGVCLQSTCPFQSRAPPQAG
jgi:hypothetical protein